MEKNYDTLEKRVLSYIRNRQLIRPGDKVMVGVSGGADSVCLLLMLHELAEELSCSVEAVTVNHGIRGREAAADVKFVRQLCVDEQIPLSVRKVDVPAYAETNGLSEETAARILRYEALTEVCRKNHADKLALAHHRDDQCETVLHHLFRGSSLKGLSGIAPARTLAGTEGCTVIRPLLETSRREIERWLDERYQTWQTDRTNLDESYTRNYIRNVLIPQVEQRVNAGVVEHVTKASEDIREAQELIADMAGEWIRDNVTLQQPPDDSEICIPVQELLKLKPILRREVLMQCLNRLAETGHAVDVSRIHLEQILSLTEGENGRRVQVPGGLRAGYEYGTLRLTRRPVQEEKNNHFRSAADSTRLKGHAGSAAEGTRLKEHAGSAAESTRLSIPVKLKSGHSAENISAELSCSPLFIETEDPDLLSGFRFEMMDMTGMVDEKDLRSPYTKYLDCGIMKNTLCWRTRKSGDYFLLENGGRKSVNRYMIDRKIPAELRDRMPLLADGDHVWWLADGRISAACRIRPETKRVLVISIKTDTGKKYRNINDSESTETAITENVPEVQRQ